jgi:hypothetical protein
MVGKMNGLRYQPRKLRKAHGYRVVKNLWLNRMKDYTQKLLDNGLTEEMVRQAVQDEMITRLENKKKIKEELKGTSTI